MREIVIPLMPWTSLERNILSRVVKTGGILRESKPPITDRVSSYSAYVWRMLQFCVSDNAKLQCMPVMCYYDLLCGSESERAMISQELEKLVDRVLETIPMHEWLGLLRWASVFGCVSLREEVLQYPVPREETD